MLKGILQTVAFTAAALAVFFAGAAAAEPLEGEWSNNPSWCGQPYSVNNDNIFITSEGYRILESGCQFTGGNKVSADHWVMKGTCSGEGPGTDSTEFAIELKSDDGHLTLIEDGQVTHYAEKCKTARP
jgi:hypothetical protein